jgi:hypothetical protein
VAIERKPEGVQLILSNRAVHVANVVGDAFGRVIEGASEDNSLHARELPESEIVWIKL